MKWQLLFVPVFVLALAVLWVVGCSGPRLEVTDTRLTAPTSEGAPYCLEATIKNQGWGHGQVNVTVRLRDKATGQTVQDDRKAELRPNETTRVAIELIAPPGAYEPEVEVDYPPR